MGFLSQPKSFEKVFSTIETSVTQYMSQYTSITFKRGVQKTRFFVIIAVIPTPETRVSASAD